MSLPGVIIRRMQLDDVEQVHEIDQLSFSLPWPKTTYRFELQENELARCWVAVLTSPEGNGAVIAMAVVWMVVDEAHIATIAVHPNYRRAGVGTQLLQHILKSAVKERMFTVTLEVRESNSVAQAMYREFGFEVVGRRPRYYHDTNEDALIMKKVIQESA